MHEKGLTKWFRRSRGSEPSQPTAVLELLRFFEPEDLAARLGKGMSPDFWRRLCPELTISSEPFSNRPPPLPMDREEASRLLEQIVEEGYLQTPPLFSPDAMRRCATAVSSVVRAGFHPLFAAVYDEIWQLLSGLGDVFDPILGQDYRLVPNIWIWHVDAGAELSGWPPHRDAPSSNTLRPDGRPTLVTVWIPFTDATPLSSCIYVLPLSRDTNFPGNLEKETIDNLQDVRALPVQAGSILGWNQYIIHWGSRGSRRADGPRINLGIYFQSNDVPPYPDARDLSGPLSFEQRLAFISAAIAPYIDFPLPTPLKSFVVWASATSPGRISRRSPSLPG